VRSARKLLAAVLVVLLATPPSLRAESTPPIYVFLWFDTEDYILPASDDAALRVAEMLTRLRIRATFKVVGEKARTLERRGRWDVVNALKKHEIGYHSNWHSVQPSPAMYLSDLGWDEGIAEFDRREGPGRDDVQRVFGVAPTCYGQPGSSWGPQVPAAMRKWGMEVYLDAGSHVRLHEKPFYYGGILTLYRLEHTLRTRLEGSNERVEAEERFLAARKKLHKEGGGIVSIYYHPCEFVHREFWDGVNFRHGANPPREQWRLPPQKTPEQTATAYETFEAYIRFIQRFPEVRFVTASEAPVLYRDRARGRRFTLEELKKVAAAVTPDVTFQRHDEYTLAASEVFALLNAYVAQRGTGHVPAAVEWQGTPAGPATPVTAMKESLTTDWSQFTRTAGDVADYLRRQGRIPPSVWLGSIAVPPEAYLNALAKVTLDLLDKKPAPETVELKPARLAAAAHVADDGPNLWGWVIFPRGFRASAMMDLAKRQAWTLKPAVLDPAPAL
jgi:hypothetical protein